MPGDIEEAQGVTPVENGIKKEGLFVGDADALKLAASAQFEVEETTEANKTRIARLAHSALLEYPVVPAVSGYQ